MDYLRNPRNLRLNNLQAFDVGVAERVGELIQIKSRPVLDRLVKTLEGCHAVLIAGPDGLVEYVANDPATDVDALAAEFVMLLRIASRTTEDTGAGKLVEHIVVSEKSIMLARHISGEYFLVLLSQSHDPIGRARYELRQAAWELRFAM